MYEQIVSSWHWSSTYPVSWLGSALEVTTISNQDWEQHPAHGEGSTNTSVVGELSTTNICWICCFDTFSAQMQWKFIERHLGFWHLGHWIHIQETVIKLILNENINDYVS